MALPYRISLAVLICAYLCVDIASPAIPAIRESLQLSAAGAGLVFSVFFAGRLIANLPAAWFAERMGPKWTAIVGSVVLVVGSVFAASASSQATLLPARALQGIGVAVLATAGLLSVLRERPGRGAAMTTFNIAVGAGGSVALLAGGFLTAEFGWRSIFWLSALISGTVLVAVLLTRTQANAAPVPKPDRDDDVTSAHPSRTGEFAAIAANLLVFANYSIWIFSLPLLGVSKFGFSAEQIGLILFFVNVVHFASAFPVGRVIHRAGAARALALGFGIGGVGMLLSPLAPTTPWLVVPMALYAVGQVAGNSSAGDLILRLGGGGGRAVGAVRLSSDVGLIAGPALAGVVADAAGAEAPFVVLGVIALAAMLLVLSVGWQTSRWSRERG
jgi:DHA1 family bicyclomycin/chloramphenicol resistance-like MFS transporter